MTPTDEQIREVRDKWRQWGAERPRTYDGRLADQTAALLSAWLEERAALPAQVGEPIGEVTEVLGDLRDMTIVRWSGGYGATPKAGTLLYASPPPDKPCRRP